jgi:hypothetical protein
MVNANKLVLCDIFFTSIGLVRIATELATQYETTLAAGKKDPENLSFLKAVFPRLKAWFHWFNSTQTG